MPIPRSKGSLKGKEGVEKVKVKGMATLDKKELNCETKSEAKFVEAVVEDKVKNGTSNDHQALEKEQELEGGENLNLQSTSQHQTFEYVDHVNETLQPEQGQEQGQGQEQEQNNSDSCHNKEYRPNEYVDHPTNYSPYYPPHVQHSPPNFYPPPFINPEFMGNNVGMPPPMMYLPPGYPGPHFINPPSLSGASSTHSSPHLNPISPHINPNGSSSGHHPSLLNRQTLKHRNLSQFNTNVYIKGLPPQTSDKSLFNMCSAYGTILSSKSIIDPKSELCRGYGFVMYESINQAQHAISCLNSNGFEASFAKMRSNSEDAPSNGAFRVRLKALQDQTSTNIYISNLPLDYNEAKLEELFVPFKIISNRILRDEFNRSRGVGFARMQDRDSATQIIKKFNHYQLTENGKPLQVRFADSTAQKQLKFSDKYPVPNFPEFFNGNLPHLDANGNPTDYTMSPPFYPVDFDPYSNGGYIPYPSGPVYFQPPNPNHHHQYYQSSPSFQGHSDESQYNYNTSPYVLPQNATISNELDGAADKLNELVEDLKLDDHPVANTNQVDNAQSGGKD